MTKTQIWVAGFLAVFIALLLIGRFFKEDAPVRLEGTSQGQELTQADKELDGAALVKSSGCTGCHGPELSGTNLAPALKNIKDNYSRDKLISYLRNPSSFMDSDRFKEFRAKYSTVMPAYNNLDIKDLGKMADYLITK